MIEVDFLGPRMIVNEQKVLRTCSEGRSTVAAVGFEKGDLKSGLSFLFLLSLPFQYLK